MTRERLPARRRSNNFELKHGNLDTVFYVTTGFYDDGRLGEVFVNGSKKLGTQVDAIVRDGAVLISIALQYGAPLETVSEALTREGDGAPSSIIGAVAEALLKQRVR